VFSKYSDTVDKFLQTESLTWLVWIFAKAVKPLALSALINVYFCLFHCFPPVTLMSHYAEYVGMTLF
jgi:hypothetical protein